jgi:DNA polymerase I-like protein with 3'-5' exonuclease and polymerase domains
VVEWQPVLCRVFESAELIVVQNGAFDLPIVHSYGINIPWDKVWDTMLAGYVANPDDYVSLSHLASLYLDVPAWKHTRGGDLLHYNQLDAGHDWLLYERLRAKLIQQGQLEYFETHLMPALGEVIIPLNNRGLAVDIAKRSELLNSIDSLVTSWHADLVRHCENHGWRPPIGKKGNLSSAKLQKILYDKLRLKRQYHPTTRQVTVDKPALMKLEPQDSSGTVSLLLKRSAINELETALNVTLGHDGRVRCRYVLGGDEKHLELTSGGTSRAKDKGHSTGRLVPREPDHQAAPAAVRAIYVPSHEGWWLVQGTLPQLEVRLTQWFSQDPNLKEALAHDDPYLYTLLLIDRLSNLYGLRDEGWEGLEARRAAGDARVDSARSEVERAFLGWCERMGPRQLGLRHGVSQARAERLIEALNSTFRAVVEYWDRCLAEARRLGYVENPFGRRRPFPIEDVAKISCAKAETTAADVLLAGQRRLGANFDSALKGDPGLGYFLTTTHDSNLVEGPRWEPLEELLQDAMEVTHYLNGLTVPVQLRRGRRWSDLT